MNRHTAHTSINYFFLKVQIVTSITKKSSWISIFIIGIYVCVFQTKTSYQVSISTGCPSIPLSPPRTTNQVKIILHVFNISLSYRYERFLPDRVLGAPGRDLTVHHRHRGYMIFSYAIRLCNYERGWYIPDDDDGVGAERYIVRLRKKYFNGGWRFIFYDAETAMDRVLWREKILWGRNS